jgi:predicted TPR repeat methyltransferase
MHDVTSGMADDESPGEGLAAQFAAPPAVVAALYDDWAPTGYDDDLASWGYDAPARAAERLADLVTGGPILDAGCGTGLVGVELHRRGFDEIIGGDFSPASVESARSSGAYIEVVHLDLNAPLDFADERFRAVVSIGVFSYLTDSEATIRDLLRVVERGGVVVFTQRTDLWVDRDFDALLQRLVDDGTCTLSVSEPQPYLPRHPEFGDDIGIYYATLTRC